MFGGFFCVSRFIILPQLARILKSRVDVISLNTNLAKTVIDKVNAINKYCDDQIIANRKNNDEKITKVVKDVKLSNSKKIKNIEQEINEKSDKNILQIKQQLRLLQKYIDSELTTIIVSILQKTYTLSPDEKLVNEILNKKKIIL